MKFFCSGRTFAAGLTAMIAVFSVPTVADAGFLDELFGAGTVTPAQPSYGYQSQPLSPDISVSPIRPRARAKKVASAEPVRQKTSDLWHDKTLRPGDAIMMKDGLHVFSGEAASLHTPKEFVLVSRSREGSPRERSTLLAMDTTRNDPLKKEVRPDTIASGRSAAVAVPITQGIRITDARGKSVRYVGP